MTTEPTSARFACEVPDVIRNRKITGMSAILLPFEPSGSIDWQGFRQHVLRTADAGLTPAVNMDTGYGNLIDAETRKRVLDETSACLEGRDYIAGVFVADSPGDAFDQEAYQRGVDQIHAAGGTPILFQSYGLTGGGAAAILDAYARIAEFTPRFYAFELGTMFAPFGAIYDADTYARLIQIPQCIGAKHSSLDRCLEWQRLAIRDAVRPEFKVLTGNDLAIDMVMYGSDYLLGLSTFAPDAFARRDALWLAGDPGFYELNDLLQYLGFFAFRPPVPAYKHNAAQFLAMRGWIASDRTHPHSPARPESDKPVLQDILRRLETL